MAIQPGLCLTWLETPKTGFLVSRLICVFLSRGSYVDYLHISLYKVTYRVYKPCQKKTCLQGSQPGRTRNYYSNWQKSWNYCKVPKFSDARKLGCKLPKIQTKSPNLNVFCQKHANGIVNSEDPDQTAPRIVNSEDPDQTAPRIANSEDPDQTAQ